MCESPNIEQGRLIASKSFINRSKIMFPMTDQQRNRTLKEKEIHHRGLIERLVLVFYVLRRFLKLGDEPRRKAGSHLY